MLVLLVAAWLPAPEAEAEVGLPRGIAPVPGAIVGAYSPPDDRWDAGHRGVDLQASPGEVVVAAAQGTVTFAALLAGRGVVVVDHGTVRTTYEPVDASVAVGESVSVGTPLGRVGFGGHCSATCLHWGLRSGDAYLDPFLLVGAAPIRLMAADEAIGAPRGWGPSGASPGSLVQPASGPITSSYGWRIHPVLGTERFHDGTDFGAPCGSPIVSAAAGVVISRAFHAAYGNRLVVDHGFVDAIGARMVTSYNHAEEYGVRVGDLVSQGQRLGSIGTTGWSTGCHLHFSVWVNGELVDPATVF